jgi:hypothetical protein
MRCASEAGYVHEKCTWWGGGGEHNCQSQPSLAEVCCTDERRHRSIGRDIPALSPGGAFSCFWWRSGVSDRQTCSSLTTAPRPLYSQTAVVLVGYRLQRSFSRGCWPAAATDCTDKHPASSIIPPCQSLTAALARYCTSNHTQQATGHPTKRQQGPPSWPSRWENVRATAA